MQQHESDAASRTLTHDELSDIIELCLWAGQILLQQGANSLRVEETVNRLGSGLGCAGLDVVARTESLTMTASSGSDFRTKTRRVMRLGVNMTSIAAIADLTHQVDDGQMDRFKVRAELERIASLPGAYNRWLVAGMVGLACAAFCRLLGGDVPAFLVTFLAAGSAMLLRQELTRLHLDPILVVVASAFLAGLIASSATWLQLSQHPQVAMSASVLLLVPGVPLINTAHDIIRGYTSNGVTRGVSGLVVSMAIALGLLMAILLTGAGL